MLSLVLVQWFHYYNTIKPIPWLQTVLVGFCGEWRGVCEYFFVDTIHFLNRGVDNLDRFGMYLANMPSGASFRTFLYYGQTIASGNFTLWDYGAAANKKIYGQIEPLMVPLENISVPVALISGSIDTCATPADVAWLSEQLGDKVVF